MITFFDIPTQRGNRPYSINTWKTRFCLNYKQLAYKTEWVEYLDIPPVYLKHNNPPTDTHPDGKPYYSVPAILDDLSGTTVMIADSVKIAQYLDETYPDTPKLFPEQTEEGFQKQIAFIKDLQKALLGIFPMMFVQTLPLLNPSSREHFAIVRAQDLNQWYCDKKTLYDVEISQEEQEASWETFRGFFDKMNETWKGDWFLGDTISFVDFVIGGLLLWIKEVWGEESKEWKRICGWNNGRWLAFLTQLDKYQTIV
ncbi:hypothetical protein BKA70DRAFT_1330870 [Coprinopsis sp. MPI-PUGE-AT-0042]|nr:hypothetical protein BKA70DRAFT_1330870 [Coprinopsis sp. MPI-PUGE-AT-0042]